MRNNLFVLCSALLIVLSLGLVVSPAAAQDVPRFEPDRCPGSVPDGANAECGNLIVYEDRANPDSRTIALPVVIFPAWGANPMPDPVVYLEGGPGGNPVETLFLTYSLQFEPFAENRDLIVLAQRGTDQAEPALDCPEYDELSLELLDEVLEPEEASARVTEALLACRDRLAGAGVNLAAYNSAASAADLNDLRSVLGYDEWNLWGISYGTRLALTAMRDTPEGIRSVILDSVYPPQVNLFTGQPDNFQRVLTLLFDACASDSACNAAYPDLENVFYGVVNTLNETPVMLDVFDPLNSANYTMAFTGDSFLALMFQSFYITNFIPRLPAVIYSASNGNFDTLAQLQGSLIGQAQFFSTGMYYSVECNEELSFETQDSLQVGYDEALADARPELQGFFAGNAESLANVCAGWGAGSAAPIENEPVVSDIPTLVMSGEYDPVTPPVWGELAAETLSNSYSFTFPATGHGSSVSGECPRSVALAFLDKPNVEPDASCIAAMPAPAFVPTSDLALNTQTIETFAGDVQVVIPDGWQDIAPGVYAESASASTAVIYQGVPGNADAVLPALLGQFGVDETPEPTGTREANGLTWTLYSFTAAGFQLHLATANGDGAGYVIIVLTTAEEAQFYYDNLFIPAVDAFTP